MRFFAFQKKPLFNRGFRREILKVAIFDPPRKPPKNPIFDHFGHFGPPFWGHFLTPFWPPKNPKNDPFWPPPKTDPPKNPGKWPFWRKPGFSSKIWTAKRGGVGVYPGTPQKGHFWPFLAIFAHFGHFCHFWPFLATFWPPKFWPQNVSEIGDFTPQKGRKPPQKPPWPDRLYLIIGLLGRKFGICAENEDFSAPPTGAGNVSESGRNFTLLLHKIFKIYQNLNKY